MLSDIRIHNECLINAGDGHRHSTIHTCHKHCSNKEPSSTGDQSGHCQKCRNFNLNDKAANLLHPQMAIKLKKGLLANLGSPAFSVSRTLHVFPLLLLLLLLMQLGQQMVTMFFCLMTTLGISGYLAFSWISTGARWDSMCRSSNRDPGCSFSRTDYVLLYLGTWGGFDSSGVLFYLERSQRSSEEFVFWISSGLQLVFSFLYLLLVYNLTLISQEHDWAKFEDARQTSVHNRQRAPVRSIIPLAASDTSNCAAHGILGHDALDAIMGCVYQRDYLF